MGLAEDLKTYVTASTSINADISGRMHYNRRPQRAVGAFIWYQRQDFSEPLTLDGGGGLGMTRYDVECGSTNLDTAYDLADKVRARLHGTSGTVGATTALGIFVEDQDEDYFLKSIDSDEAINIAALSIIVHHRT